MKRTDITELFPEATKEQIDKLLDLNSADITAAKSGLDQIRTQAAADLQAATDKAAQLQGIIDNLNAANTARDMRERIAKELGVPYHLLNGDTEDACRSQAEAILSFAKTTTYPAVKDGGEVQVPPQKTTRDQFADWFKEQL